MAQVLIHNLIRQLNELQEGSLWFDQSFKDKFDNLSDASAFSRPLPELHSVAEHVSHMLEWRKECVRRYHGNRFDLMHTPDDWKDKEELKGIGWQSLKQALYDSRQQLIDLIKDHDDSYLLTRFQDTAYNHHYLMEGIIQHDLYHLGQIGITIKLLNKADKTG